MSAVMILSCGPSGVCRCHVTDTKVKVSVKLDFNSLKTKCKTEARSSGLLHKFCPFQLKPLPKAFLLGIGTPNEAVTPNGTVHGQGTKTISRNSTLELGR